MLKYFLKEINSNSIKDRNGAPIAFEPLGSDYGVIKLDDSQPPQVSLIQDLDSYIEKRIGGVVSITEGEYGAKKAAFPWIPSVRKSDSLRVLQSPNLLRNVPSENVVVDKNAGKPILPSAPAVTIPTEPPPPAPEFKLRRGKIPQNEAQRQELLEKTKGKVVA